MDELLAIARERKLFVVEDAAQAFGAKCEGRRCGSLGDAGAFSFCPSENLGGFGDGGMVTTDNSELCRLIDMLRRHGTNGSESAEFVGYSSRLDTLQAAVVLAKLNHVEAFNSLRRQIAVQYTRSFARIPGITPPPFPQNGEHVYNNYTLRCADRDRLAARLRDRSVSCQVRYPVPLHKMKAFEGRSRAVGTLLEAERAATEVLSLPIEPLMSEKEFATVAAAVQDGAVGH
jgi:dTDP-4-amino-4,6-dideoxygalactose transaminase